MRPIVKVSATVLAFTLLGGPSILPMAARAGEVASATPSARAQVQHLLRRFAFSAPPGVVDEILRTPGGASAWVDQQLASVGTADPVVALEPLPTKLDANGSYPDWFAFERVMLQDMLLNPRQIQAKLELHWLDHFSVSNNTVGDPGTMWHYVQVLRNQGLGNFAALMTTVAREAAMLEWLDNNGNTGPVANENFAREAMQLYTMGPYQLNMDGSVKTDSNGVPLANYSEADVQSVALAMTGYSVVWNWNSLNPQTRFSVTYTPSQHAVSPLTLRGRTFTVPNTAQAMPFVIHLMAHDPSTAPFQAKELLQRFVTENPSPQYVSDIAAVWASNVDAPDQIAQVVKAIIAHPEFNPAYHAMLKQPVEMVVGLLRQIPGVLQASSGNGPGSSMIWTLGDMSQDPWTPPSVFSFYRPGDLSSLTNTSTRLNRTNDLAWMVSAAATDQGVTTYIDIGALRRRIGSKSAEKIADYLLDTLVDGGTPALHDTLLTYLKASNGDTPGDNEIRGAIWLLVNAPAYAVN
jgi:uncharacterized protein (DUF1800 family)